MTTEAAIERWDKILNNVEIKRRCFVVPLEVLVPGHPRFQQGFQVTVDALTNDFSDAWDSDRPSENSALHAVLEPVARAAQGFHFTQPAAPQVNHFMTVVAEARSSLADGIGEAAPADVVADIEKLLKVTVLVARVGHQGAMRIADIELAERNKAVNKATERAAQYLDLNTMQRVGHPSNMTVSMAVFLAMVGPRILEPEERLQLFPDEKKQPPIMRQFAAQWVVNVYTEWEEHYRPALATALGCNAEDIRCDYFADLKRMRQDYVHHRGVAQNSGRNKVLKWFSKRDIMIPTNANYRQLLADFPAEELLRKPEPVIGQRQQVPAQAGLELVREFEKVADSAGISKDAALDEALSAWIAAHR